MLYAYAGYPWLLRRLPDRPPRRGGEASPFSVSVVMAARGSRREVEGKIRELLRAPSANLEAIVVLDGPDPEAAQALARIEDQRLTCIVLPERAGKAEALNRAVAAAKGDVLVFTDVRQLVNPEAIDRLVEALRSPDVGAVSGALRLSPGLRGNRLLDVYWKWERRLRFREARWDSSVGVTGALYALKRELWKPLPLGLLLDDLWVPMCVVRAGLRVGFEPRAVAVDRPVDADSAEFTRKVRTLTGNYQLMAWMPWVLNPFQNRIWWQFLSHKALRLLTPLATLCVVAGVLSLGTVWALITGVLCALTLLGAWVLLAQRGTSWHQALGFLRSGIMLQLALTIAGINAIAGRWDLWTEPVKHPPQES